MAELEQQVGLDISQALSDADNLAESAGIALDAALTAAIEGLSSQFVSVSDEIQSRLAEAFSQEQTVPVTADTTAAEGAVTSLVSEVDSTEASINVDADTSSAEDALSGLADSADEASTSLSSAAGGGKGFADSAGLIAGGAALARGEVGGLTAGVGALDGASAAGLASVAGLGASVAFLFEKGLDATSMLQRFNFIVGDMADQVLTVKVGTLNEDLDKLAIKLGTDDEALRNASASVFQFAVNAGASRKEAADFTNQVDALAARAIALNPALGTVDKAAETLEVRLARGGRFASSYGLSLTTAEINTRALANTQKTAATDLTIYEKSQAAAQIAVERYGNTLNDTVTKGAKNAALEQRSLKEQLDNVFEAVGKPLVSPILQLFKDSQPVVGALGQSIGDLATAAIPLLDGALRSAVPLLQTAATVVSTLTDLTDQLGITSTAAGAALGFALGGPVGAFVGGLAGLVSDLGAFNSEEDLIAKRAADAAAALRDEARALSSLDAAKAAAEFERFAASQLKTARDQADRFNDVALLGVKVGHSQADEYESILTPITAKFKAFTDLANADVVTAQKVIDGLKTRGVDTSIYERALAKVVGTQKEATAADAAAVRETTLLTGSYEDQIKILSEKNDAVLASLDKGFALTHAAEAERDAVDNLNTAYDEAIKSGKTRDEALEAQRRAETSAEEAVARAAAAVRAKSLDDNASLGPIDAARQATLDQIGSLEAERDTLAPGSPLRVFIQGLIDKLRDPALNTTHTAGIAVTGVDDATAKMTELNRQLAILATTDIDVAILSAQAQFPHAAAGGDFYGAAATAGTFVGEAGTEFVRGRPGGGFTVYSNPQVRAGAGSSATPNVELNVDVRVDSRGIATTTITDTQGNTLAVKKQQVRADVRAL